MTKSVVKMKLKLPWSYLLGKIRKKIVNRKLDTEQHYPNRKPGLISDAHGLADPVSHMTHVGTLSFI